MGCLISRCEKKLTKEELQTEEIKQKAVDRVGLFRALMRAVEERGAAKDTQEVLNDSTPPPSPQSTGSTSPETADESMETAVVSVLNLEGTAPSSPRSEDAMTTTMSLRVTEGSFAFIETLLQPQPQAAMHAFAFMAPRPGSPSIRLTDLALASSLHSALLLLSPSPRLALCTPPTIRPQPLLVLAHNNEQQDQRIVTLLRSFQPLQLPGTTMAFIAGGPLPMLQQKQAVTHMSALVASRPGCPSLRLMIDPVDAPATRQGISQHALGSLYSPALVRPLLLQPLHEQTVPNVMRVSIWGPLQEQPRASIMAPGTGRKVLLHLDEQRVQCMATMLRTLAQPRHTQRPAMMTHAALLQAPLTAVHHAHHHQQTVVRQDVTVELEQEQELRGSGGGGGQRRPHAEQGQGQEGVQGRAGSRRSFAEARPEVQSKPKGSAHWAELDRRRRRGEDLSYSLQESMERRNDPTFMYIDNPNLNIKTPLAPTPTSPRRASAPEPQRVGGSSSPESAPMSQLQPQRERSKSLPHQAVGLGLSIAGAAIGVSFNLAGTAVGVAHGAVKGVVGTALKLFPSW